MAVNLDHTPHPLVEEHWHIRELINAQEKRQEDRMYHRQRIKDAEERSDDIAKAASSLVQPFWCEFCKKDFLAQTIKQSVVDWCDTSQSIAFYKTKCFKGHWCVRLITDKHRDRYFFRSRKVNKDRGRHYKDTLQSFETGYNMLYGKK
jgi:hypothetical protein